MHIKFSRSTLIALAIVVVIVLGVAVYALSGPKAAAPVAVGQETAWQGMMDYFIQDVCLDKNGNVLMGVSPIDGNPLCVAHRDLMPGERLPYHKENPRGNGDTDRLDEFPIQTDTALGIVAVKIKDNYGTGTDKPNVLDISDGIGNIYTQSSTTISTFATIDANGPTFRISAACSNAAGGVPDDLNGLLNAQIRVTSDALTASSGSFMTTIAKVYNPGPCPLPADYTSKLTNWKFAYYSYTLPSGAKTPPLKTLITNGVGDGNHFERYYQTREVGRTRYEAWQDTSNMDAATLAQYQKMAASLKAAGGDCATQYEPKPAGPGTWLMYACGEWTTFSPPTDMQHGDYPDQFIAALKAGNMTSELFGLAPTDNPKITSVAPATIPYGQPATLTFTGNFAPHDAQGEVIVMFDGGTVYAYVTPTNGNTTVTYQISWDSTRKGKALTGGVHTVNIFDGVSMSNAVTVKVTGHSGDKKGATGDNTSDPGNLGG